MDEFDFFDVPRPNSEKQRCDAIARTLLGSDICPVPWQGAHTYTVQSSDMIVQFRSDTEKLDRNTVKLAKRVHGHVVPSIELVSEISEAAASIWIMSKLPGVMFLQLKARDQLTAAMQECTIKDMARFFAEAWKHPQQEDPHWLRRTTDELLLLEAQLPSRFQIYATRALQSLPRIAALPWVLTHSDLSSANVLVNYQTGELTGIVDWGDATICPHGRALWGIESLLTSLTSSGCNFIFANHEKLRSVFVETFQKILDVKLSDCIMEDLENSRLLGLLLRYGFDWTPEGQKVTTERSVKESPCNGCDILDTVLGTSMFAHSVWAGSIEQISE